jgi:cytochrome c
MMRFRIGVTSVAMAITTSCGSTALAANDNAVAATDEAQHAVPVAKHDARALLTQYKCYICHADREAKAGPAYAQVAAYHRGKPDAVSTIALDIRRGLRGGTSWHMPPHPEVTPEEARAMARYIMSLDR